MEQRIAQVNGNLVLRLHGQFDFRTSPRVRKALHSWVKRKAPGILVNLSAVEHTDSSGVATLIECAHEMEKYGGVLLLTGVGAEMREAFSLAGVADLFRVIGDEKEAPSPPHQG